MSFLEDATKFMAEKQKEKAPETAPKLFLSTPESRTTFEMELRALYENATLSEIARAVDWGMENMEKPYDKKLFLQKIRVKLED